MDVRMSDDTKIHLPFIKSIVSLTIDPTKNNVESSTPEPDMEWRQMHKWQVLVVHTGTGTGLENLGVDREYLLSAEIRSFEVCWVCETKASGRSGVIMHLKENWTSNSWICLKGVL